MHDPDRQPDGPGFTLVFTVYESLELPVSEFLQSRLAAADRARLGALFLNRAVCLNGEVCSPQQRCCYGDQIRLWLADHREGEVDTGWYRLWENDELLAVYKPHQLPVSRTTRNLYNTLISLVRRQTPFADARLLHRLDTETAGVILLAKHAAADKKWKSQLAGLISRKIYHAWVYGQPDWSERVVECELAEKKQSPIRSQVYVVADSAADDYLKRRVSKTAFRVLECKDGWTLIECQLFTGRKHQIRSQLAFLGHPVVGDKIYAFGGRYYLKRIEQGLSGSDYARLGSQYHRLIARSVTLEIDQQSVEIDC